MTNTEKAFCEYYVTHQYNGTRAYLAAKPEVLVKTARERACAILKKEEVRQYIKELEREAFEAHQISAEHIANELASMAFGEVTENSRLSYSDKQRALELLGKQINLYNPKIEVSGLNSIEINIKSEDNEV